MSRYLTKGKQLLVVGEPTLRTYPKRDRTQGAAIAIHVDELHFVGGKPAEGASAPAGGQGEQRRDTSTTTVMNPKSAEPPADEDVPF